MKKGFVLPSILITTVFLSALLVLITSLAVNNFRLAAEERYRLNAQFAADAGIDKAIVELNTDNDWSGTGGEVDLMDDGTVRTTYQISVSDGSDGEKILDATGRTYRSGGTELLNTRNYEVLLEAINNTGTFSVVTGVGGLYMSNSSKIVGGDVFVNGEIRISNTGQIGSLLLPVDVKAAHQVCPDPPDATYPTVCAAGENGEPISVSVNGRIYGEVVANNQTDDTNMYNPGLVSGSVTPSPLPTHDRAGQISNVALERTGVSASCTDNNGNKTWEANTHITGDVSISKDCIVTVKGDVWIDGKMEMFQGGKIVISDLAGTDQPNIMVDGPDGIRLRNSASVEPNLDNTGAQFLTYHSAASCSPDCSNVTGADLANSRTIETISFDNSVQAGTSIFFAKWTQLTMYNSGGIGAVVGQTVDLRNSSVITFGAAVPTSGTNQYTYLVDEYRRDF